SIDPAKQVVIVLDSNGFSGRNTQDALDQIPLWKGSADDIGLDPYPCYQGSTTCDYSWIDRTIQAADSAGIPYWGVVQAFNDSSSAPPPASTTACPSDTTPPSTPPGLSVTGSTQASSALSWTASTDNVSVTGYNVSRGSTLDGTSNSTTYTASSLNCGTSYTFTVQAKDAAGNVSSQSGSATATTAACSGGGAAGPATATAPAGKSR